MRRAPTSRRPRFGSLAAVVIGAVIALGAGGCTAPGGTTEARPAATPTCASPDYCPPASWDTAKASTPLAQIPPFSEPLNVVISARSTVSLAAIQQAMGDWHTVSTATSVTLSGIHLKCISSEQADVTGGGYVAPSQAWRLGGYEDGAATFVAAIASATKAKGWHYSQRIATVTGSAKAGEGGVPFNGDVYVLTVTT